MNSNDLIMLAHKVGVQIQKLPAKTITAIKDAPHAQKKTADYKKTVYIVKNLVFKGPYTCDKPDLFNNLRYTYAIQLLEEALDLPGWQRGALPWDYIGQWGINQYYLVAPNVGKCKDIPFKRVSSKFQTDVPIVPRCGFVWRVSDVEQKSDRLTNDIKLASLQNLYLRFVLGIADLGTYNILIRENYDSSERLIAGIDLEQRRGVIAKSSKLNFLFSNLRNKQIGLYKSDVSKIKPLSYEQLNQRTIDRLRAVDIDLDQLKENMELWKKSKLV